MSRIGKNPIVLPAGVEVTVGEQIVVKGPLGVLKAAAHPAVTVAVEGQNVQVSKVEGVANAAAMWGTMRANLNNMVNGVSKGFERKLQLVGVGYRAQAQGDVLNLSLGFSHPVAHKMPVGVKVECPTQTEILIKGSDRKPEPYKGKGVRYSDEVVVIKETKKK
ncbi:MAG: 50S ribosomal protein L6 [Betaproteobacteria bacterium HGW-Betaproteobacteria-7]|nr:MAG: 50S ribosomal protein L6 [Betaproteobacteria bacterium HGW-Betaproteobacteria-7]